LLNLQKGDGKMMLKKIVWLTIVSLVLGGTVYAGGDLQVGTCMKDITPISSSLADEYQSAFGTPGAVNHSDPIFLAGFGNNRQATGYNDRLWARGVVFDGRGGRVALVALDLVGYFINEVEVIRGLISPDAGIDYLIVHTSTKDPTRWAYGGQMRPPPASTLPISTLSTRA
jgi:hypothetical protein